MREGGGRVDVWRGALNRAPHPEVSSGRGLIARHCHFSCRLCAAASPAGAGEALGAAAGRGGRPRPPRVSAPPAPLCPGRAFCCPPPPVDPCCLPLCCAPRQPQPGPRRPGRIGPVCGANPAHPLGPNRPCRHRRRLSMPARLAAARLPRRAGVKVGGVRLQAHSRASACHGPWIGPGCWAWVLGLGAGQGLGVRW